MSVQTSVLFHGVDRSPALEEAIDHRATDLGRLHAGLLRVRAVVSEQSKRQQQGRQFSVHLELHGKGYDLAVTQQHDADAFIAVGAAFDAAKRKLMDKHRSPKQRSRTVAAVSASSAGFVEDGLGSEFHFGRDSVANTSVDVLNAEPPTAFIEDGAGTAAQVKRVSVESAEQE